MEHSGNEQVKVLASLSAKLLQLCPTVCNPVDYSPQVPLSMGFSRQEYWSGLSCPPPGDLPELGIKYRSPALQSDSLPSKPKNSKER